MNWIIYAALKLSEDLLFVLVLWPWVSVITSLKTMCFIYHGLEAKNHPLHASGLIAKPHNTALLHRSRFLFGHI